MQNTSDIDELQVAILRQLVTKPQQRFSDINVKNLPSDKFSYHLRRLLAKNLIEKNDDGLYRLTPHGKTLAINYQDTFSYIKQGLIGARVVALRSTPKGVKQVLIQQRTMEPFLGYLGLPGGRILYGEALEVAAARTFKIETGFTCKPKLVAVAHFIDRYKKDILLDKYFYVFAAQSVTGSLKQRGYSGTNSWMNINELPEAGIWHMGALELVELAFKKNFGFIEREFTLETY